MSQILFRSGEATARTTLYLPRPADLEFLFQLAIDAGPRWSWFGRPHVLRALEETLWQGTFDHAVIVRTIDQSKIGYLAFYDMNDRHNHVSFRLYLSSGVRFTAYPFEAVEFFIDRLFERTNVRNIYIEYAEGEDSDGLESDLLVEEARFRDRLNLDGALVDRVTKTLTRSAWQSRYRTDALGINSPQTIPEFHQLLTERIGSNYLADVSPYDDLQAEVGLSSLQLVEIVVAAEELSCTPYPPPDPPLVRTIADAFEYMMLCRRSLPTGHGAESD